MMSKIFYLKISISPSKLAIPSGRFDQIVGFDLSSSEAPLYTFEIWSVTPILNHDHKLALLDPINLSVGVGHRRIPLITSLQSSHHSLLHKSVFLKSSSYSPSINASVLYSLEVTYIQSTISLSSQSLLLKIIFPSGTTRITFHATDHSIIKSAFLTITVIPATCLGSHVDITRLLELIHPFSFPSYKKILLFTVLVTGWLVYALNAEVCTTAKGTCLATKLVIVSSNWVVSKVVSEVVLVAWSCDASRIVDPSNPLNLLKSVLERVVKLDHWVIT